MDSDYIIKRIDYSEGGHGEFGEKNGRNHGPWRTFHANGQMHLERFFVNGREDGTCRKWNAAGQLIEEQSFLHGQLHGHWRTWDENGVLVEDDVFEYGDKVDSDQRDTPLGELEQLLKGLRSISIEEARERHNELTEILGRTSYELESQPTPPPVDRITSACGIVTHLDAGESWPMRDGQPMVPLLQIRMDEIPELPAVFDNVAVVAVFGPHEFPLGGGMDQLEIRRYSSMDSLLPVSSPDGCLRRKPALACWKKIYPEYPSQNDLAPALNAYLEDEAPDSAIFEDTAKMKTKVGGWPAGLQFNRISSDHGEFAFQLDSLDFADWDAGDSTVFYCFYKCENNTWWSKASML